MKKLIVTGSNGLIGSEVVTYFDARGWDVHGVDNNMRRDFFGEKGDTRWNQQRLESTCAHFTHHEVDIRSRADVLSLVQTIQPDMIVHAAAQPSHDLAASRPFDDFDVNAGGTLNLLEATRQFAPDAVFAHMSTNKVYGDRPNTIAMNEFETRYDYADPAYANGIDETMSIDQSKHSVFGASKVAADVMVQEYGRYFGMKTCCLRGGCLTGPNHSGVELHGFLSYLIRCNVEEREYTIYGYKGKQVRDNIHAYDVARAIETFYAHPQSGAVFNLGGGRANSVSILEAFDRAAQLTGKPMRYRYSDQARAGDHICYISDLTHMKAQLPGWDITRSLEDIFEEIVASWHERLPRVY
ncbi:NAD-dependent epimerase/dehydratase family protein [Anaerolineae bacterium CFX9]|nr:NAD-dependent epimerase/dehydratase family protein [Anaerolineae bacterium CFX9]